MRQLYNTQVMRGREEKGGNYAGQEAFKVRISKTQRALTWVLIQTKQTVTVPLGDNLGVLNPAWIFEDN